MEDLFDKIRGSKIEEIWADNLHQTLFEKVGYFETCGRPEKYIFSVKTIFSDPRKKAIRKARKFAKKWYYNVIFYRDCKEISGIYLGWKKNKPRIIRSFLFRRYDLRTVLYTKAKSLKILEDDEGS